jgi:hypothetical protein
MKIRNVEDLLVYQKALAAADAVSALLKQPDFSKDFDLKNQLGNSSSRVPALIAEGYEQKSDRHFAHYLLPRERVGEGEQNAFTGRAGAWICVEIKRMLDGLIDHLERDDRDNRRA